MEEHYRERLDDVTGKIVKFEFEDYFYPSLMEELKKSGFSTDVEEDFKEFVLTIYTEGVRAGIHHSLMAKVFNGEGNRLGEGQEG